MMVAAADQEGDVCVREFDAKKDSLKVDEMEHLSDLMASTTTETLTTAKNENETSILFDFLGDPMARIRYFLHRIMLVAECRDKEEIVGVIRCCIKMVTQPRKSYCIRIAYVLGLRISPNHRRRGIGMKLVEKAEEWCRNKGAEYIYMATDRTNTASLNLFIARLSYVKFRSLSILVRPVHAHRLPLGKATIIPLPPSIAARLYRRVFASSEFFPNDIATILSAPLTLGTFLAVPQRSGNPTAMPPGSSFAVMSVWNSKDVFRVQVKGIPMMTQEVLGLARAADERFPWLRIPSVPDLSTKFGVYFMYGLYMEGKVGASLMRSLCKLAHNMARDDEGCAVVVTEVGRMDPMRYAVPNWRSMSWDEDVWCMKWVGKKTPSHDDDWMKSQPSNGVVFVDPRDF